jgi:uncharacterized membrane protein YfcA
MDVPMLILLGSAVFGASCLQSATGIGYGVIAGPIFLVVLNGIEAFQISTIHNFCIALILLPMFWGQINRKLLCGLVVGSFGGIPFGFYLQTTVDIVLLKIAASLMVGFVTVVLILGHTHGDAMEWHHKKNSFREYWCWQFVWIDGRNACDARAVGSNLDVDQGGQQE